MERSSLIFAVICFAFYMGYNQYLDQKYPTRHKPPVVVQEILPEETPTLPQESPRLTPGEAVSQTPVTFLAPEELTLENKDVIYRFDQMGGRLREVVLKNFQEDETPEPLKLVKNPMTISPFVESFALEAKKEGPLSLSFSGKEGLWRVIYTYKLPETGYGLTLETSWINEGDHPLDLETFLAVEETVPFAKTSKGLLSFLPGIPTERPQVVLSLDKGVERFDVEKNCRESLGSSFFDDKNRDVKFFGVDSHYFFVALIPDVKTSHLAGFSKKASLSGESCVIRMENRIRQGQVLPGEKAVVSYSGWFGPKSDREMEAFKTGLSQALDLGFFSTLGQILLTVLRWVYDLLGNWGLAIIAFTSILKVLFYPLTRQAHISMSKLKKLQPKMNEIKEKNKDDPMKQQQELMAFMSANKVNPMKGCLPILPQIPVFIAFYRVLSSSVELRNAPFGGWIKDLSVADPYLITPILWIGLTLLQQKISPNPGMDKTQEKIMMMMPLIFGVMMISLPSGLILYMLTNTLLSIGQQQWLQRRIS
jgi:YidC/Oxa1 family membrane protein insertase